MGKKPYMRNINYVVLNFMEIQKWFNKPNRRQGRIVNVLTIFKTMLPLVVDSLYLMFRIVCFNFPKKIFKKRLTWTTMMYKLLLCVFIFFQIGSLRVYLFL